MWWGDLPALIRFRSQVLPLDSALFLTHGNPLGPLAVAAYLNPAQGIYTGVCPDGKGKPPLVGQVRYTMGARCARLVFVLPVDGLNSITLPGLLEHLTVQAGEWGAMHFLAEVEDGNETAFEGLRRAGFSVYAWQRLWKFTDTQVPRAGEPGEWQPAGEMDVIPVRGLYQSLVPALVQPMEPILEKRLTGMLLRRKGDLLAFADLAYGPTGIVAHPFIHPSVEDAPEILADLIRSIPRRAGRPVYLSVRSYQGWLDPALEGLGVEAGPRQALMVRHLAITQRVSQTLRVPNMAEAKRVKASSTLVNSGK